VIRLLPDKLATAYAIAIDPVEQNGSFLIGLVLNLLEIYLEMLEHWNENSPIETSDSEIAQSFSTTVQSGPTASDVTEDPLSLIDTVKRLKTMLKSLFRLLNQSELEKFLEESRITVKYGDEILAACHTYLGLIHPLFIKASREGQIAETALKEHKSVLNRKLISYAGKMYQEFETLCAELTGD